MGALFSLLLVLGCPSWPLNQVFVSGGKSQVRLETSAGKIPEYWDQVGVDSFANFFGSRTDSGFVRLRIFEFGSRSKLILGVAVRSRKKSPLH